MRSELMLVALAGVINVADARDPFQPPATVSCAVMDHAQLTWCLLGVTGRNRQFMGWFLSPAGGLTGITSGETLSDSNWIVASVDEQGVTLQGVPPCEAKRIRLPLQGTKNEKNSIGAGVVQHR